MIGSTRVWRRMAKLWLPGLLLLIINLAVLSTYRALLAGQSQISAARLERMQGELEDLETYRQELEDVIGRAEENRQRIDAFYDGWISSEAERLTQVLAEVKRVARQSGVQTSGFRYPDEVLEEFGLVRRSIVFSAEGSYASLRRFVDALERSEQFLMLENIEVSDSGRDSSEIRVRFAVSTLFLGQPALEEGEA